MERTADAMTQNERSRRCMAKLKAERRAAGQCADCGLSTKVNGVTGRSFYRCQKCRRKNAAWWRKGKAA